jgi:predicted peptidase
MSPIQIGGLMKIFTIFFLILLSILVTVSTATYYPFPFDTTQSQIDKNTAYLRYNKIIPYDEKTDMKIITNIYNTAKKYNVDFWWCLAVAHHESFFDTAAMGNTGDHGLFQITMSAVKEYEKKYNVGIDSTRLCEIEMNTEIAIAFIRMKLDYCITYNIALAR